LSLAGMRHRPVRTVVLARQQEIDAALGLHQDNAGAVDAQEAESEVCA